MIKCMVVDDEVHGVNLLKSHIAQVNFLNLEFATTNPLEAINKILTEKIDLVFLDIHMPQMSGLEFVQTINGKSKVILCTAYAEYALEGFEHNVVDYLLKPISFPRFLRAAQKAMHIIAQEKPSEAADAGDFIFVKTEQKGKMVKVVFSEVLYIESMGNYVRFASGSGKVMALFTMKEVQSMLPQQRFLRVHNSYIVNLDLVTGIEGNELVIKGVAHKVPIGITFRDAVFAALKIRRQ
jgi:two-component system, LytTR family, response regulator